MVRKLTDFSPAALIKANRANVYELFRSLEHSTSMDFMKMDGFVRWSCSFQYAWFNAVLCARDVTPADVALIDQSLAYFKSRQTEDICWWLEDDVDQASWEVLLIPRGFTVSDGPPGMSMDLNRLPETANIPAGVQIRLVHDEQGLRDCTEALMHGYGFPPEWESDVYDFLLGIGLNSPYQSYVAYLDDRPVATAAVFFGSAVAGIYSVATLPEARGKGIGTAITVEPLLEARRRGYHIGTLQSSKMGFPIYQKMGFEQNFTLNCFYCNLQDGGETNL